MIEKSRKVFINELLRECTLKCGLGTPSESINGFYCPVIILIGNPLCTTGHRYELKFDCLTDEETFLLAVLNRQEVEND